MSAAFSFHASSLGFSKKALRVWMLRYTGPDTSHVKTVVPGQVLTEKMGQWQKPIDFELEVESTLKSLDAICEQLMADILHLWVLTSCA